MPVPISADAVRGALPSDDALYDLAALFKMFGDPTRAKILSCLQVRDLYVGEIAEIVGMSDSAISHQLRILRGNHVIKARRDGQNVVYSLADAHVMALLSLACEHLNCKF